jgi:hypothetical protein
MLNEREHAILKEIYDSEEKMIWVANNTAFVGASEYPVSVIRRLIAATAIRELGTQNGITRYELSATGNLIVRNPEAANQVAYAVGSATFF